MSHPRVCDLTRFYKATPAKRNTEHVSEIAVYPSFSGRRIKPGDIGYLPDLALNSASSVETCHNIRSKEHSCIHGAKLETAHIFLKLPGQTFNQQSNQKFIEQASALRHSVALPSLRAYFHARNTSPPRHKVK